MAGAIQPTRLTNAIVEAGLVLASVVLGVVGLGWPVLGVTVVAAVGWWLYRHQTALATLLRERPGRLAVLVPLSLGMIGGVHAAAFWVARSIHGVF